MKSFQLLFDRRQVIARCSADRVFSVIAEIGGQNGWYYADWLWRLRGFMDTCAGGVGMRRNGTNHRQLRVGEILDFWYIEDVQPGKKLRLRAEMKVPGDAWLEFEVCPHHDNSSMITQTAHFQPHGIAGMLYWYTLLPIHILVFRGMIRALARKAESMS